MFERAYALAGKASAAVTLIAAAFLVGACTSSTGASTKGSTVPAGASTGRGGSTSASSVAPTSSPASSDKPIATTPVPPPSPGSIHETVATRAPRSAAPIALSATATPQNGVAVSITRAVMKTAKGRIPGEVSGPAVWVTVQVANSSHRAVTLSAIAVNVADASGLSWTLLQTSTTELSGSLAAGQHRSGIYVFHRPAQSSGRLTVTVQYSSSSPTIVFVGRAG